MTNISIIKLLANRNFITVNKTLIKNLGLYEAVLLGEFASEYSYWEEQDKLEDDYFFSTIENIENNTGINGYYQRESIKKMKELGIIETKKIGLPAKRYIRLNINKILEILDNNELNTSMSSGLQNKDKSSTDLITSDTQSERQVINPVNSNKNKVNKNKTIKNNNKNNIDINSLFEIFYQKYPLKKSKEKAISAFKKALKKVSFETIMQGLDNYIKDIEKKKTEKKYIKHPATWLNQGCWDDEYENTVDKSKLFEIMSETMGE